MVGPLLSGIPDLVPVTSPHGVTPGGLLPMVIFSLSAGFTGVNLDTLYPWNQQYPVLYKWTSRFQLAVWELLFSRSAWSEATSLTSVALARVRLLRLLAMLEISVASWDPAVATLATASEMLFK